VADKRDHDQLAAALAAETERVAQQNERLAHEIDEVRAEWEAKRRDRSVPGTAPPAEDPDASADRDARA
jgi:hypothetical protein